MKILEVTNLLAPVHGGSAEVPYQISRSLAKKGHQVTIYTSDFKSGQSNRAPILGVSIHAFRTWASLANFQITLGITSRIKNEIKLFNVIHLHNYRTFQNIAVCRYARKHGVPYIIQAHGSLTTYFQKGLLKKLFDNLWGRRILREAARVIAVTRIEAEQYRSMGVSEDKIEVVPNGIDLAEFDNLPEQGEFREKYKLGSDLPIILYLGRIHKVKGLDLLVKAFAEITRTSDDIRLVIVGPDDGYLAYLKKIITSMNIYNKVLFTGPLYGQEKLEAYVDADMFVNPRTDEIFGLVFLEALACGTPVICSEGCGIADIIRHQAGLVVPYEQDKLQEACLNMLNNDRMRLEFGAKGKTLVRQNFNWEKITEQLERVYQEVQHK